MNKYFFNNITILMHAFSKQNKTSNLYEKFRLIFKKEMLNAKIHSNAKIISHKNKCNNKIQTIMSKNNIVFIILKGVFAVL